MEKETGAPVIEVRTLVREDLERTLEKKVGFLAYDSMKEFITIIQGGRLDRKYQFPPRGAALIDAVSGLWLPLETEGGETAGAELTDRLIFKVIEGFWTAALKALVEYRKSRGWEPLVMTPEEMEAGN